MTVLAALGCSDEQYLPFALDLLYTEQLNSKLQPVCSSWHLYCYMFILCLFNVAAL